MCTSLVLEHTKKESVYFGALQLDSWEAPYDDILRLNPSVECSAREHPKRTQFFERLDTYDSVVSLIDATLFIPIHCRIRFFLIFFSQG